MSTAKQIALDLVQKLPEDASFDDIHYELYVRQKIGRGLADVEAGRTLSHEEVQRRIAQWLGQ